MAFGMGSVQFAGQAAAEHGKSGYETKTYKGHAEQISNLLGKIFISGGNMIRNFRDQDLDRVMELWLNTNIAAHSFIDREYWKSNYDAVKSMMPRATIYICEENNFIRGFIGLMGTYIAGIFVHPDFQSNGIGKSLLNYAKDKNEMLSLHVYQENVRAVHFYLREHFAISNEQVDENTGKIEWRMDWKNKYHPHSSSRLIAQSKFLPDR